MIKLYGVPISNNVAKVRYCLSYLELEYEFILINLIKGENRTEDFRRINPTGKVPAIDIDGFKLFESNSINRYLATSQSSPIYPTDQKQRALVEAWMDYGTIHVGHAQGRVGFNRILAPVLGIEPDEASVKAGLEFLDKYLPIINKQLDKQKYLAGGEFSLADITMLAVMDPFELCRINLEKYDNIVKWRNELKAEPFYQKYYEDFTQFAQKFMSSTAS